jgi:hypothetical protein
MLKNIIKPIINTDEESQLCVCSNETINDGACTCIDGCKCYLKKMYSMNEGSIETSTYGLITTFTTIGTIWYLCCK